MADIKITELPDGGRLAAGDILPIVRTADNFRATAGDVAGLDSGTAPGDVPVLGDDGNGNGVLDGAIVVVAEQVTFDGTGTDLSANDVQAALVELSGLVDGLEADTAEVKVSATDTTAGFLNSKVTVGSSLEKSITDPAADEKMLLDINSNIAKVINWKKSADIAAAGTTDLSTATGNLIHITGTTGPITSFGTVQAGAMRLLVFDAVVTITYHATNMILPGNANITTAAGDAAIFLSEGSGAWRCIEYTRRSGKALVRSDALPGQIVGSDVASYTTSASLTPIMPFDDSVPQNNEGAEFLSQAYTMVNSANKLRISYQGTAAASTVSSFAVACFKDSDANALHSLFSNNGVGPGPTGFRGLFEFLPAAASVTIKLRAGGATGGAVRLNGGTTARLGNGNQQCTLLIEEIQV